MDDEFNPVNVSFFNKLSCFYDKSIREIFEFSLLSINFTDSNFFLKISQCFDITKLENFKKKKTPIPVGDNIQSCLFENWSCMDLVFFPLSQRSTE
jgi:hypothetical protein